MIESDVIIENCGPILTCSRGAAPRRGPGMSELGILPGGSITITNGKIEAISTTATLDSPAKVRIDACGRAVSPGFVDPHSHIVFGGDRFTEFELKIRGAEYLEILASGGGIISTVAATRAAEISELVSQASTRLDRMLACGTTTCEIKTGYGLDTETEIKMLRVIEDLDQQHPVDIVPTFLAAHAIPPEHRENPQAYVDLICDEMLAVAWRWYTESHFPSSGRPFFIDVFTEKNAFDLEQSERILNTASSMGFLIKAHVDEFTNLGGSRSAIGLGAVSIDHLDAISDEEVELLAKSDTVGVVTPGVNFNFGSSHFADARKMIDRGCAIALSTDYNPGSAPSPSQPMTMAIACRYQKLLPAEAFTAATINAAHAIGMGETYGSIEAGKAADILILDTTDYREICYEFGMPRIHSVIKSGRVVI